jgi:hypothetical protein
VPGPTGPTGATGPSGSGSGDVVGPASSVADAPVLFNGTTGKLIKETTYGAFATSLGISAFMKTVLDDTAASTALATLTIVAGTYTPTITNGANVAASTAFVNTYLKVGNIVIIAFRCDVDPTASTTATSFEFSLPVATNFASNLDASGAGAVGAYNAAIQMNGSVANDRGVVNYYPPGLANAAMTCVFMYTVLP